MEAPEPQIERSRAPASAPGPALSLLRYSPAFLAFIIVIADAGRWADPDLWGHLVLAASS
jgi:hypothetical protein